MGGVTLVALPYDSGHFDRRMGAGPLELLGRGLADDLSSRRGDVEIHTIRLPDSLHSEGQALVALQQFAVVKVREAIAKKRRILILSGNCGPAALSAVPALGPRTSGVVWFDAHADFNTPETSASGFLDGMALSILTGRCWRRLAERFDGFEPVEESNVVLVGARALDAAEAAALEQSSITRITPDRLDLLEPAVTALAARVANIYVHLDVDVLDEAEGRANSYACGGGLSTDNLIAALELLNQTRQIGAASMTAYDPECDGDGKVRSVIEQAATILTT